MELAKRSGRRITSTQPVSNYRIVLRGTKPGRSVDEVAQALARYSKKSPEKLRALLSSGKHMVAKRTTQAQQATQYKLLLEKLGCDCMIEAELTEPTDSVNVTSVLVTDVADAYSDEAAPRRGVTYAQRSRFSELMESIGRVFRPSVLLVLAILLAVLYFGWQQLL